MKIVLREDVEHLGQRGEIVKVAPGYARNFLLPKGLAYLATDGNLANLKAQERAWKHKVGREMEAAEQIKKQIEAQTWVVKRKAGESGTLYGSVTTMDLGELMTEAGIDIDRRKIVLKQPVKTLGLTEIPVKLHSRVTATAKLDVQADGALATESADEEAAAADAADAAAEAEEEGMEPESIPEVEAETPTEDTETDS